MGRRGLIVLISITVTIPLLYMVMVELHLSHVADLQPQDDATVLRFLTEFTVLTKQPAANKVKLSRLPAFPLPPLSSILDVRNNIIGDPQPLLQFAIIGFGKCGTSTLLHWLANHPQIQAVTSESYDLVSKKPWQLIRTLHQRLKAPLMRGYKCPGDIHQVHVIDYFRTLWPKTKLFVGIRHPVLWFQSLYNFRVQTLSKDVKIPHGNYLIGGCFPEMNMVCTVKGDFAYPLMRLGKQHWNGTRPTNELDRELVAPRRGRGRRHDPASFEYLPNDVFLFDVTQLGDKNLTRKDSFRHAVQNFLGLTKDLPDVYHVVPGLTWAEETQAEKDAMKIDICERQYIPLRRELMYISRLNANWIRNNFLDLPGVFVANRDHLVDEILELYMHDPCGPESDQVTQEESDAIFWETKLKHWATPRDIEKHEADLEYERKQKKARRTRRQTRGR